MRRTNDFPATAARRLVFSRRLGAVGIVFLALGVGAVLVPTWATFAAEQLLAVILTAWGAVGLWFAWEVRGAREWLYLGVGFGAGFLLGLGFLLFPGVGVEALTIVLMVVFLIEGIVSILLGLRISASSRRWGWMVFSGLCSLGIGVMILIGWPETALWTLGLLLGVNFLSSGLALVMVAWAAP